MNWVDKYKPQKLDEIVGQKKAVEKITGWLNTWKTQKKKALLLHGSPGIGKTLIPTTIAKEFDFEFIDLNASDERNKDHIHEIIGSASKQRSLFAREKLIFMDEIDGLSGTQDRGGASELAKVIKETSFPIIMAANDPWASKLQALRNYCDMIKIDKPNYLSIAKRLGEICKKEGVEAGEDVLKAMGRRANGDFRAAIHNLEQISSGKKKITIEDMNTLGDRDTEQNVFETLRIIFKTLDLKTAIESTDTSDLDPDMLFQWVRENICREYLNSKDITSAYNFLSRADVFRGRIRIQQHWRFLIFQKELTAAVSVAKAERYKSFVMYQSPENIRKLMQTHSKRDAMKNLGIKLGERIHVSSKVFLENMNFYKKIFSTNPKVFGEIEEDEEKLFR